MPVDSQSVQSSVISAGSIWVIAKAGMTILVALYFVFSLVVIRQINFMTEIFITETAPLLRAFSIIHAGLALGIILLFIGLLFG